MLLAALSSTSAATIRIAEFEINAAIDVNGVPFLGVRFGGAPGQVEFNRTIGTAGSAVLTIDPILTYTVLLSTELKIDGSTVTINQHLL